MLPENADRLTRRMQFLQELEETFWQMWFRQYWEGTFPRGKWKLPLPNLQVGEICLKGWTSKMGKGRYQKPRVNAGIHDRTSK